MGEYKRDPDHWLLRFSPDEWIRAALAELRRAKAAYDAGNTRAGGAGVKRAAGMALNAALIVEPNEGWGRTYVEHVEALSKDERVPQAVREACRAVLRVDPKTGDVVILRTPRTYDATMDAARDVIAHAWAVVRKNEAREEGHEGGGAR
jgi:HEPN domain-containing protein